VSSAVHPFRRANKSLKLKEVCRDSRAREWKARPGLPAIAQNWSNIARIRKIATGYGMFVQNNVRFLPRSKEVCTKDTMRVTPSFPRVFA
jgi:hypothetical protein